MITKIGFDIISPAVGAIRAGGLTDEERAALLKKYDLGPNGSLVLRNAGRGLVGGIGGLAGGSALGYLGGTLLGTALGGELGGAIAAAPSALIGGVGGYLAGTKKMTDKYSRDAAHAAILEQK